ncbi:hypothetical protein Golob_006113 [Gossypium lobatum]|uniref:Uncharacterized protein n=1 Tax=Gossypium lobatum TaxID=34289 RepID=A0A7J8MV91_9ROSI|nr:hypothetical protein [Gossypium lobatum]
MLLYMLWKSYHPMTNPFSRGMHRYGCRI